MIVFKFLLSNGISGEHQLSQGREKRPYSATRGGLTLISALDVTFRDTLKLFIPTNAFGLFRDDTKKISQGFSGLLSVIVAYFTLEKKEGFFFFEGVKINQEY